MPAAVKNACIQDGLSYFFSSATAKMTAGTMPQDPAVGQATIRNICAFASLIANAYTAARLDTSPNNMEAAVAKRAASPPTSPLTD